MSTDNDNDLERLAGRLAGNPLFFAFALAAYQRQLGIGDRDLCALLGCSATTLLDLRLCRRPGAADSRTVEEDVLALAGAFNVPADVLRRIVAAAPL